jgi:thioredoxin reductase (NADPH)
MLTPITMYGTTWCSDCKRAKKFLGEQRIPYTFVDVDQDAEGLRFVEQSNDGKHIIPTIKFGNDSLLVEPSNAELAAKLGLQTSAHADFYELIVVGGGPAGLTAALYAAREGVETLVIDQGGFGGQAGLTERLDNFPGFPEGVSGTEFADRLVAQARRFGVELLSAVSVSDIDTNGHDQYRHVRTDSGHEYHARALLLTPGSHYRRLGVPGEEDLIGAGVHYCATCDGPFYRDRDVAVVGGGNSAAEEGVFLTNFAKHVTLLVRGDKLTASQIAQEKVKNHPKMSVEPTTVVREFRGNGKLSSVLVENTASGATHELHPAAVFVLIGLSPNTGFVPAALARDAGGFLVTGLDLQTNVPGVFAAGDVRAGSTKQVASAAGEGATAALMIRHYLQSTGG